MKQEQGDEGTKEGGEVRKDVSESESGLDEQIKKLEINPEPADFSEQMKKLKLELERMARTL